MSVRLGDTIISGLGASLPDQTGNSGKFLTTNGTNASWETLPIVSSVSSSSTNSSAVGAKLFYDTIGDIETALHTINSGS